MMLLIAALALLAVPALLAARWIAIAVRAASHEAAVAAFLQFLPEALRDPHKVTLVAIGCGVAALFLAWMALRTLASIVRMVAYLVIGAAGLLVAWNLFGLM